MLHEDVLWVCVLKPLFGLHDAESSNITVWLCPWCWLLLHPHNTKSSGIKTSLTAIEVMLYLTGIPKYKEWQKTVSHNMNIWILIYCKSQRESRPQALLQESCRSVNIRTLLLQYCRINIGNSPGNARRNQSTFVQPDVAAFSKPKK